MMIDNNGGLALSTLIICPAKEYDFRLQKGVWLSFVTKSHLVVRHHLWSFGEYGIPLHCHYSHVHSHRKSYFWVKKTCLRNIYIR